MSWWHSCHWEVKSMNPPFESGWAWNSLVTNRSDRVTLSNFWRLIRNSQVIKALYMETLMQEPWTFYKPLSVLSPLCCKEAQTRFQRKTKQSSQAVLSFSSHSPLQLQPMSDCSHRRHFKLKPPSQVLSELQSCGEC